jgi:hypothetical protein
MRGRLLTAVVLCQMIPRWTGLRAEGLEVIVRDLVERTLGGRPRLVGW